MAAPITSYGYSGTIAPNAVWGKLQWVLGARYWVADTQTLSVTAAGPARQVSISKGFFGGYGILDELTSAYAFTFPTASTTTWYLLAARRTWGTTQATDFVAIDAGTGAALPSRETDIGVVDDQPVALVQVNQNGTIGTVRDLRAVGGKDYFVARDDLVLSYMAFPGYSIRIGDRTWRRTVDASNSAVWRVDPSPLEKTAGLVTATGAAVLTPKSGWSGANMDIRATRDGNVVEIDVELTRTGGVIQIDEHGGLGDTVVANIATAWRPTSRLTFALYYIGGDLATDRGSYQGLGVLEANGDLYLIAGSPSMDLNKRAAGERSLSATITFIQR